jgi:hypothetical protein
MSKEILNRKEKDRRERPESAVSGRKERKGSKE